MPISREMPKRLEKMKINKINKKIKIKLKDIVKKKKDILKIPWIGWRKFRVGLLWQEIKKKNKLEKKNEGKV